MMLKRWQNKDFKNYMSNKLKERWAQDEEYREIMSNSIKEKWEDVEHREMMKNISKEKARDNIGAGFCSICGKYNKSRDLICRGKDNKIWINDEGESCGCSCSQEWYLKHNNTPEMIEIEKQNRIKQTEFYKKELENKLKALSLNIDISSLLKLKGKNGIWILNDAEIHESNDLYSSIIKNINNFDIGEKIKIIQETNKLEFNLNKNNISKDILENLKEVLGLWISDNTIHETQNLYDSIKNNINILSNNIKIFENVTKLEFLLKDTSIRFNDENLNFNDFNILYNIPGVWAIWGINLETSKKRMFNCRTND